LKNRKDVVKCGMLPSWLREPAGAFRDAFANRDLRRLELAYAGSVAGDWCFNLAIAVYAYEQGGAKAVGLLSMARWLIGGFSAPFLAVLADRYPRRSVMCGSDAVCIAVTVLAAVAVWTSAPPILVYLAAILVSASAGAFEPAQTAIVPTLTETPEQLTAANVATGSISSIGSFAGPAIGGIALAVVDLSWVIALDAVSFIWSFLLLFAIAADRRPERPEESVDFVHEVTAGFVAVGRDTRMRAIVALASAQVFVLGAVTVLIVVLALGPLSMGESGVGTLNAAVGVGGLVGSVVAALIVTRGNLGLHFAVGLLGWGLPIALIAGVTEPWFALAMFFVVGVANVPLDVACITLLQRIAPNEIQGRVFGALETSFSLALGLGAVVAPVLLDAVGTRATLIAFGSLLPVLVAVSVPILRRLDVGVVAPERLAAVRATPIFAPLPEPALERIASQLDPVAAPAGTVVMRQGDAGDRFYLVVSGELAVDRDGATVAQLGPGDHFGEIALVRDVPRTATVRAVTDVDLLALDRDEFIATVTGHDPSREAADAVISARLGGMRAGAASL
jgi:MFS family permease